MFNVRYQDKCQRLGYYITDNVLFLSMTVLQCGYSTGLEAVLSQGPKANDFLQDYGKLLKE